MYSLAQVLEIKQISKEYSKGFENAWLNYKTKKFAKEQLPILEKYPDVFKDEIEFCESEASKE
jgi:hypothetical protein